ncbi:integrase [Neobacillus sp. B4I6]|uniref:site-specific integrase n=1 Tax=Neobacillus sp. B4I6 TaxID=3373925 RepID=UPI003D24B0FF
MKGYFRKRGDKWSFTIDIGRDPATGKRTQKTKSGFKTKKAAQEACAELITELSKGVFVDSKDLLLKDLVEEWLDLSKVRVRDTTFKNYFRAANTRIIPALGQMKVKEINHSTIQKYINELIEEGLTPRYIEYLFTIINGATEHAVKTERLMKNPLQHVEVPRARRRDQTTWTIEEVNRFLHFAKFDSAIYYMVLKIAIHTGMRRGEVLGLRWQDVDLQEQKISVTQSLVYDDEGFRFSDLKTASSKRLISIDDDLTAELKRYKAQQNQFKLALGSEYHDMDLVCCREDGRPIYPRTLATHFDALIKKASVPKIRLHDLRHTHATILLKLGENPKIVSERLGHSTVTMTLDTYSHVTPDMQKNTADKFGNALQKTNFS